MDFRWRFAVAELKPIKDYALLVRWFAVVSGLLRSRSAIGWLSFVRPNHLQRVDSLGHGCAVRHASAGRAIRRTGNRDRRKGHSHKSFCDHPRIEVRNLLHSDTRDGEGLAGHQY